MSWSVVSALTAVASFLQLATPVQAIPYSEYILAPRQRVLAPVSVYNVNGTVSNAVGLTETGIGGSVFSGDSAVTYDYSKAIGGIVSFSVSASTGGNQSIGLSFTESSLWISPNGSDATQNVGIDKTLWFQINSTGNYTVQHLHSRGSFRYLNVYHSGAGNVTLSSLTTYFNAMPHYADEELQSYTGYFHSSSEKLNRVWYAAAYTNQLCTIPTDNGNSLVDLEDTDTNSPPTIWWSNSTLTNGSSALVDGAKRDKLIWPGDQIISGPGVLLSTNDAYSIKISLEQVFANQNTTTGQLPYVASPLIEYPASEFFEQVPAANSFTYHLHGLLSLNNYYIYTGDLAFVQLQWNRVKLAVRRSLSYVDDTGLANVTSSADWLRNGMGGHNIEANSILAYTLDSIITLAYAVSDLSEVSSWANYSANVKTAANTLLWDNSTGFYKDNETTTLHPQDGNVWAIISGVADSDRASTVSHNLAARWTVYGPPAPEAGTTVSPFISGLELQAHLLAGNPQYAIGLTQSMWADFMLDDPRMTNSTFNEGYSTDGSLHYPAYADDIRISHAHGWSTGPIIALTNYVAGLHVLNATHWAVHPQPGNLTSVEAGFTIAAGAYSANYTVGVSGATYSFSTPNGTTGSLLLDLPGCGADVEVLHAGEKRSGVGRNMAIGSYSGPHALGPRGAKTRSTGNGTVTLDSLQGGDYVVTIKCS